VQKRITENAKNRVFESGDCGDNQDTVENSEKDKNQIIENPNNNMNEVDKKESKNCKIF